MAATCLAACGGQPSPAATGIRDTATGPRATSSPVANASPITNPRLTLGPSATTGPSFTYADAVAFWDGERGIVGLSLDRPDGSSTGQLLVTGDGGRNWRTGTSMPDGVVQVAVAASKDAWALTGCGGNSGCQARLYRSMDGGDSWTSAPTDLSWISFVDALDGWGVAGSASSTDAGLPALRQTHDGGATWAAMPTPCAGSTVGPLRTISARSATTGLAVCTLTAGAGGELHAVLATTDGGAHWTVRASTGDASGSKPVGHLQYGGYITGIVEASDGTAWISGGRMIPLATRDGGTTWRPLALGDEAANLVQAAWPLDSSRGFAVMWSPDRQATLLEATTNGGRTWTERSNWSVTGTFAASP